MLHITVSEKGHQINTVLPSCVLVPIWKYWEKKQEEEKGALPRWEKHKGLAHE